MSEFQEKPIYQKISTATDWIVRVVVINLLIVICALGVVTFYPALLAGFELFDDYKNKVETKLFRGFFTYFKDNILRKMLYGLFFVGLIFLGIFAASRYVKILEVDPSVLSWIGFVLILGLVFLFVIIMLYSLIILIVFKNTGLSVLVRQALYLAGKFFLRTLLFIVVWAVPVFLMFVSVLGGTLTLAFVGIALPLLVQATFSQKILNYIYELGERNDHETDTGD